MTHTLLPAASRIRRRGLIAFLTICFAWSWASLGIAHLAGFSLDNPVAQLATVALVPAASAAIVRLWVTREGFSDAGLRPRIREHWRTYLSALVIPIAVLAVGMIIAVATGMWDLSAGVDITGLAVTVATGPLVVIAMSVVFLGEEFGWTAYLRDRLLPGRPVATTFGTGIIWGVWHFPLPWVGYFGGDTAVWDAVWAMLLWLPLSILLEFLIGWLWAESGSVWPGALLHAGCNLVAAVGMDQAFGHQMSVTATTLIYCAALVPFVLVVIATGHLGRPHRPQSLLESRMGENI